LVGAGLERCLIISDGDVGGAEGHVARTSYFPGNGVMVTRFVHRVQIVPYH
jgi:hypothetical protein